MYKFKLVIILFLTKSILAFSQNSKEVIFHVFDSNTKKNLVFANIYLEKNNLGNATDLDGLTSIKIEEKTIRNDFVRCSYVGYKEKIIQLNLTKIDTLKISLEPKYIALDEILVLGSNTKLTGKELVRAAIKNIAENYLDKPSNLKTFYREKLIENDKCIELNEALCTFYYTKYPQKGYVRKSFKQFWSNEFRENHPQTEKGTFLALGTPQFFRYYNTQNDKCYIRTSAISDNLSKHDIVTFIEGGPLSLTAIDKVKYLADFLDPKLVNQYQYYRKSATYIDSVLCIAISFKPKMLLKSVFQGWHKKVGFPLYSGTIFISTEDLAIVRFESQFSTVARMGTYQLGEPWQIFPKSIIVSVDYAKNSENKWHLKSVYTEQIIKRNSSVKWIIPDNYNFTRELLVSDIIINNVQDFDNSNKNLLKDMNSATLRNFRSSYKEKLWQEYKTQGYYPYLVKEELESLEKNYKLSEQFKMRTNND